MTTLSPEIPVGEQAHQFAVASANGIQSLNPLFIPVLLRLGCLSELNEGTDKLKLIFERSVRAELQACLTSGALWSRAGLWMGYTSFFKTLQDETDDLTRDVLTSRYVLSQTSAEALFATDVSWSRLSQSVQEQTAERLSDAEAQANLSVVLRNAYTQQRDAFVRELAVRALPTVVLVISTMIAIVMASFVWRSLFIGN